MAHLLKTLPVDLTHELIAQTSKEASNTVQFSIPVACYYIAHLALS